MEWNIWVPISSQGTRPGRGTSAHGSCYKEATRCATRHTTSQVWTLIFSRMCRSGTCTATRNTNWSWVVSRGGVAKENAIYLGRKPIFPLRPPRVSGDGNRLLEELWGESPGHHGGKGISNCGYSWRPGALLTPISWRAGSRRGSNGTCG